MIDTHAPRLDVLRTQISKTSHDGYLVPMADEFQSEYVPNSARRIEFLSGFTGSAGFIIVLKDKAAFFTDGRYTLQAAQQINRDLFQIFDISDKTPSAWLSETLTAGQKIAYDPWLHTASEIDRLQKAVEKAAAHLEAVDGNLVDTIWTDRPAPPTAPIEPYDLRYAGISSADKRQRIAEDLKKHKLSAAVLTDPTSIAWLLNIRGGDVPNTPLPLSFAILHDDSHVAWFVDSAKLTPALPAHLGDDVDICPINGFLNALAQLSQAPNPIRIDSSESAIKVVQHLKQSGVTIAEGDDPCVLPKACKNTTEVDGMRAAHQRDAVALVQFLYWLDHNVASSTVTELSAEARLAEFRHLRPLYRGPSFDTIAGCGPHGAIVHYRATPQTNRVLELGQMFLLDSGGQYLDGTTDVTRTMILGNPTPEMRDRFTRVLKGHIALAAIRFPKGTTGGELDVLARQHLWATGLDYSHGTGHGVGSYLGVHEGPQAISKRSKVPLQPGMVVSNEPGFYKSGEYGIRIENLQVVVLQPDITLPERTMYGFESLTLVPIDRRLIDPALLTEPERVWLNAYHVRVYDALQAELDSDTLAWLTAATAPI